MSSILLWRSYWLWPPRGCKLLGGQEGDVFIFMSPFPIPGSRTRETSKNLWGPGIQEVSVPWFEYFLIQKDQESRSFFRTNGRGLWKSYASLVKHYSVSFRNCPGTQLSDSSGVELSLQVGGGRWRGLWQSASLGDGFCLSPELYTSLRR